MNRELSELGRLAESRREESRGEQAGADSVDESRDCEGGNGRMTGSGTTRAMRRGEEGRSAPGGGQGREKLTLEQSELP